LRRGSMLDMGFLVPSGADGTSRARMIKQAGSG
jgi:hypothetical protein